MSPDVGLLCAPPLKQLALACVGDACSSVLASPCWKGGSPVQGSDPALLLLLHADAAEESAGCGVHWICNFTSLPCPSSLSSTIRALQVFWKSFAYL